MFFRSVRDVFAADDLTIVNHIRKDFRRIRKKDEAKKPGSLAPITDLRFQYFITNIFAPIQFCLRSVDYHGGFYFAVIRILLLLFDIIVDVQN